MDSEIIRLGLMALVGVCVSVIYWSFVGIFTEKKWVKLILSILMMGVTVYLST